MKIKDLIHELKRFDPEGEIEVPVQTYTQAYPSGYFELSRVTPTPWGSGARLYVHLGEGFIISKKKSK